MNRARSLVLGVLLVGLTSWAAAGREDEPKVDPINAAWDQFAAADPTVKAELLAKAKAKVESSLDPEVKHLIALRDRARKELKIAPPREPEIYDHAVYAPVAVPRVFEPEDSSYASEQEGLMQVWANPAPYLERVRYDFAANEAVSLGRTVTVEEEYWDLLAGNIPDTDLLVVWLMKQWDFDPKLDKLADHFGHAYCDRVGHAFKHITLYDAYRSAAVIETPDTDVIAFARRILKDNSYVSPLPADRRHQKLDEAIKEAALKVIKHRTMVEYAARIYVNNDAPLPADYDGLRLRYFFVFEENGSDPAKIAKAFIAMKDRDGFVDAMDKQRDDHREHWNVNVSGWPPRRTNSRWTVANAARDVFRDAGFLPKE